MMLGNLSIEEIETRLGIPFPDETRKFMEESHQANAEHIAVGKWHCFDMPFQMVCGDMETAQKIYNSVLSRASEVKQSLAFGIQN